MQIYTCIYIIYIIIYFTWLHACIVCIVSRSITSKPQLPVLETGGSWECGHAAVRWTRWTRCQMAWIRSDQATRSPCFEWFRCWYIKAIWLNVVRSTSILTSGPSCYSSQPKAERKRRCVIHRGLPLIVMDPTSSATQKQLQGSRFPFSFSEKKVAPLPDPEIATQQWLLLGLQGWYQSFWSLATTHCPHLLYHLMSSYHMYMGLLKNWGYPKAAMLVGKAMIKHRIWGLLFLDKPIYLKKTWKS